MNPGRTASARALRPAIVLLFACTVTPVLLWLHPVGDYFVETDFYGGYAPGVRALFAHGLDPARYGVVGPVYELVLGLLSLTRLDLFRLAQFLSLGSTVLALLLFSGWMERRFGRGAGWISALLVATNPTVFRYAYTASTDAPFACLLAAAFVLTFPQEPRPRTLLLAGIVSGLATLTRYNRHRASCRSESWRCCGRPRRIRGRAGGCAGSRRTSAACCWCSRRGGRSPPRGARRPRCASTTTSPMRCTPARAASPGTTTRASSSPSSRRSARS
jgi:hypothetical protein